METPPRAGLISLSCRRERSTSSFGRSMSSFIRSMTLVPPARNFACGFAATARAAAPGSVARAYLNGLKAVLPADAGELLFVDEPPRVLGLSAGMDFLDGGDDLRVGAAAADVAAHALADLVVAEPRRGRLDVRRHVADVAAAGFFEQADRRADLS